MNSRFYSIWPSVLFTIMTMRNPVKAFKEFYASRNADNMFRLDGAVPIGKSIPFGIQHVLAMFVANIAPILICFAACNASDVATSNGIRSAILMAALGTIIQLLPIWRVGSKLPIFAGCSFTFLGVLTVIGSNYGLGTMFVSIIIGGLLLGILGLFADKWTKVIKPIVSAIVVLALGLSLLSVGINDFLSISDGSLGLVNNEGIYQFDIAWPYLIVAFVTLITCLLWQIFVKGAWKNVSILAGLVVGYIVALCFIPYNNMVDFSAFSFSRVTDFIDVPRPYFTVVEASWGDFNIGAILTVLLIYVVNVTENLGGVTSLTSSALDRDPTGKEISGCISGVGFASAFAGFFGSMPLAVYSQNVGIVSQSKVTNRFAILTGPILLFIISFFPPITTLLMTIPKAVLGGIMLMLFASIAIIGMQMIAKLGFGKKNIIILSISIGLGYGITLVESFTSATFDAEILNDLMIIFKNPVANMFLLSFLLSYVIPDSIDHEDQPAMQEPNDK